MAAPACRSWGIGSSPRSPALLTGGLALLILSTIVIGYGNYLGAATTH